MIRIATFNLENLFTRPVAMNQSTDGAGRQAIEDHASANRIVAKDVYSAKDKADLLELTQKYRWHFRDPPRGALVQLQKIRGQLFRKPQHGPVEVVANGRDAWVGWFELLRQNVTWEATFNTGRVIGEVQPDILITVEVENRFTLQRFNEQVLGKEFDFEYPHSMVIDGNDERGIDLGILSRFPIVEIRSHIDELVIDSRRLFSRDCQSHIDKVVKDRKRLFSRDCPEFDITLPGGERLIVIANHLKSKRNGNDRVSQCRREAQAKRAHKIAVAALSRSPFVLLGGDLNDTPDSSVLASLFTKGFKDVMSHPDYPEDRPGTYKTGLARDKLDYLIMSPQLRARLQTTGIERRGSYHPNTWEPFDTVTRTSEEASDHHLLWADFNFSP